MRTRLLVLVGIVAASVTASGKSVSDSPERPETMWAAPIRTGCDAGAAVGSVFTAGVRPGLPFTLQLPQLRDWQVAPAEGDAFVLRADRHAGRMGSATVALSVSTPRRAAENVTVVKAYQGRWRQWRSGDVQVCGGNGTRSGGILSEADSDGADHYREFLGFDYPAGDLVYPISMSVDATAADQNIYRPDIDTFVDGLQVVLNHPAG
ncbi:hypothetical protein [Nocardia blacklockiae]|uniref:hypothetical protein n=1 Tax=Nocardia blacklockiae TaxID=480036 RepID=UPI001893CE43|nr:hypothetical protein [Nocardia blacklockiae]MBF6175685.1 hypothetical protein [Nocardia blacklockiae]